MAMVKFFRLSLFIISLSILLTFFSSAHSKSLIEKTHFDKTKVPMGCGSCHIGHGRIRTPMLPERRDQFCFTCHGDSYALDKAQKEGRIAKSVRENNIKKEFEKPSHHPIERNAGLHTYYEILPEIDSSMPRHVSCGDCHHHHFVSKENKMLGIRGTTAQKVKVAASDEYELCFNCHSYSANLPLYQTNKAELFNISSSSFHPVVGPGKNISMTSLIAPLTVSSQIKCTDCHGSDDPTGPRGPHGSQYKYILSKNFSDSDGPENITQYELCYSCHRRNSILNNESFSYHNLHISDVGTSCRTCHNPHGSTKNQHLIDFESASVIGPSTSGRMAYTSMGPNTGQCYLTCHDKDHNPEVYPKGSSKPAAQTSSSKKKK